jgi:hypothetical protein
MFCPTCRDEYRPGFTRCATCDVDLVERLGPPAPGGPRSRDARPTPSQGRLIDYCGFLSLDDARRARDRVRALDIRAEITIRDGHGPGDEEYWLRVERDRMGQVVAELGEEPAEPDDEPGRFQCGACGASVAGDASACPKCGARFEDET